MSRKEYLLLGLVAVLAGVYAAGFTGWFRPRVMQIEHSARAPREAWNGAQRVDPTGKQELGNVTFTLHGTYKLTSVKVVPLAEFRTNKYVPATWALVAKAGSERVGGFAYGLDIPGMKPARELLAPDPLQPGMEYRLIVEAGSVKAEHDFKMGSASVARR